MRGDCDVGVDVDFLFLGTLGPKHTLPRPRDLGLQLKKPKNSPPHIQRLEMGSWIMLRVRMV